MEPPALPRLTPRQIRKAFGPQAVSAIDSHADAIEGLTAQVLTLTQRVDRLMQQMDAVLDALQALQTRGDVTITRVKALETRKAWWTR